MPAEDFHEAGARHHRGTDEAASGALKDVAAPEAMHGGIHARATQLDGSSRD